MTHTFTDLNKLDKDLIKEIFTELSGEPIKKFINSMGELNTKHNKRNPEEFSQAVNNTLLFLIHMIAQENTIPILITLLYDAQCMELKLTSITREELMNLARWDERPSYVG